MISKPRLFIWGWWNPDSRMAIARLKSEGLVEIPVWFADTEEVSYPYSKYLFNQPKFPKQTPLSRQYQLTLAELFTFTEMFSRTGRGSGISIQEVHHIAHAYFNFFCGLITRERITHMTFSLLPCPGLDYLASLAGRRLKIRNLLCYQSLIPNRFFYMSDLEDFGEFQTTFTQNQQPVPAIELKFEKKLFYMNSKMLKKDESSRNRHPISILLKGLRRFAFRTSSKPKPIAGVFLEYSEAKNFRAFYKKYSQNKLDLNIPFVYFGLQLQPELTTSTLGGIYADQLSAIEAIRAMIPNDWLIYVKENPKQGFGYRGANFYTRLLSLPNVVYVSKQFNTYELLSHCQFAGTITGSVGWESISGLKPSLIFGKTWYQSLPGAVQYREDLTYEEILNTKIHPLELQEKYQRLMRKTRDGIVDPDYKNNFPQYSQTANVSSIYELLKLFILKT